MTKAPSFFKFFIAPRNNIDMEIPIAFTRRMEPALPEKVFLRDRHNNVWVVKLAKVGGSWYFVDGWEKFVEDNSLATGDLLVFLHLTGRAFHVKLYGPNATEKNVGVSTHRGIENQEHISKDDDIIYDEEYDNETESEHCANIGIKKEHGNEENQYKKDKETVDADGVFVRHQECELRRNVNNNGEHQEVTNPQVNKGVIGENGRQQKPLMNLHPKCYGMEIFEAGLAEQPTNPYFVAKIMLKRKRDLFIPKDVIKDYNINLGDEVILVDPSGREFSAKCRKWKDGRSVISGAWTSLCRVNLVSLEDICICEFVKRHGDDRHFLNIRFVRNATVQVNAMD